MRGPSIIVKNVEDIMDTYLKMDPNPQEKGFVTMDFAWFTSQISNKRN